MSFFELVLAAFVGALFRDVLNTIAFGLRRALGWQKTGGGE